LLDPQIFHKARQEQLTQTQSTSFDAWRRGRAFQEAQVLSHFCFQSVPVAWVFDFFFGFDSPSMDFLFFFVTAEA
jgi:hypothetical protein